MNTSKHSLKIVVGLLVYNGADYIEETIESILSQTLTDFQLVIGDNRSTDLTEQICRQYARQDERILYVLHPENLGASGNHNALFEHADAPYFKWASHDDLIHPEYLEKCIKLLDTSPSIGVAHSRSYVINEESIRIDNLDGEVRLSHAHPSERFWRLLWGGYLPEVHGVMRTDLVKKTKLFRGFPGDDRSFLVDMLLQADVGYVEDYLFSRRDHMSAFCSLTGWQERQSFFNPKAKRSPHLNGLVKLREYLGDIYRYPMSWSEKLACIQMLALWGYHRGIESATGSGEIFGQRLREEFSLAATSSSSTSSTLN
ncbi:MAG: glycosyltransferase family A protein [Nodosilinea sp.]